MQIVHENSEFFQDVYFVPFYRLIFSSPVYCAPPLLCRFGNAYIKIRTEVESTRALFSALNLNSIVWTRITRYSDIFIFIRNIVRKKNLEKKLFVIRTTIDNNFHADA